MLRCDDSFATVVRWGSDLRPSARALIYRQLIDLLAQGRLPADAELRSRSIDLLRRVRDEVPRAIRLETAEILGRQVRLPREVAPAFLGEDPDIAGPVLQRLSLTGDEWRSILPDLAPPLRAYVSERADLPDDVRRMAMALGSAPLALPSPETSVADADILTLEAQVIEPEVPAAVADEDDGYDGSSPLDLFEPAPDSPSAVPLDVAAVVAETDSNIRELIERIERYRERHHDISKASTDSPPPQVEPEPVDEPAREEAAGQEQVDDEPSVGPSPQQPEICVQLACDWRWETDRYTALTFIDMAQAAMADRVALTSLLGASLLSLLQTSVALEVIEDCLRRRVPFRDRRVNVAAGALEGDWLLSGVPVFDSRAGLFLGYRGTARQISAMAGANEEQAAVSGDTLHELAHEVRTPLNAIMGFAQLIEAQARGPVDPAYRERAAGIVRESQTLLSRLDSINDTLTPQAVPEQDQWEPVSPAEAVDNLMATVAPVAAERGIYLVRRVAPGLPSIRTARRMLQACLERLTLGQVALTPHGGSVVMAALAGESGTIRFELRRSGDDGPEAQGIVPRLAQVQATALQADLEETQTAWTLVVPGATAARSLQAGRVDPPLVPAAEI